MGSEHTSGCGARAPLGGLSFLVNIQPVCSPALPDLGIAPAPAPDRGGDALSLGGLLRQNPRC